MNKQKSEILLRLVPLIYLWQKHQSSQEVKRNQNSLLGRKTDVFVVEEVMVS